MRFYRNMAAWRVALLLRERLLRLALFGITGCAGGGGARRWHLRPAARTSRWKNLMPALSSPLMRQLFLRATFVCGCLLYLLLFPFMLSTTPWCVAAYSPPGARHALSRLPVEKEKKARGGDDVTNDVPRDGTGIVYPPHCCYLAVWLVPDVAARDACCLMACGTFWRVRGNTALPHT